MQTTEKYPTHLILGKLQMLSVKFSFRSKKADLPVILGRIVRSFCIGFVGQILADSAVILRRIGHKTLNIRSRKMKTEKMTAKQIKDWKPIVDCLKGKTKPVWHVPAAWLTVIKTETKKNK